MLEPVLIVVGALVVAAVFLDAFATTLVVATGAGPFTRRLLGLVWRGLLRLHRTDSGTSWLSSVGTVLLVTTVLVWVAGLWVGWTLIFLGAGDAIINSTTRTPAGIAEVVYFTGYTVFTIGLGDYVATTSVWRVLISVAGFSGLFLVTLAITYLVSVVSAVVARRALAIQVHALGTTADAIVVNGWAGDRFASAFVQQLSSLTSPLARTAEQHLAYPALHYFHTPSTFTSAPLAVASLDDALLLLSEAVETEARPEQVAVRPLREVVERYLATAVTITTAPDRPDPPPPPHTKSLVDAGVPVVDADTFRAGVDRQRERRRNLARLVHSDGWSWPQSD